MKSTLRQHSTHNGMSRRKETAFVLSRGALVSRRLPFLESTIPRPTNLDGKNPFLQKALQNVATILSCGYSEDLSKYTGKLGLAGEATILCNINQSQGSILHHRPGSLDTKP
jgi:hypothetical protein